MRATRENVNMPAGCFPVKVFVNRADGPKVYVHPHWHDEIEILYVMSGNAVQYSGDRIFHINSGDIVIIGSGEIHSTYTEYLKKTDILVIQFDTSIAGSAQSTYVQQEIKKFNYGIRFPNPIHTGSKEGCMLHHLILNIKMEFESGKSAENLYIKSDIEKIMAICIRYFGKRYKREVDPQKNKWRDMLGNSFRLVDEKYGDRLTLEEAAAASNLSRAHFCRLFKRLMGMTFNEYLNRYRITAAVEMLEAGRSVTETAFDCGFGCANSFIRNFKQYKKVTPGEFIKKNKSRVLSP